MSCLFATETHCIHVWVCVGASAELGPQEENRKSGQHRNGWYTACCMQHKKTLSKGVKWLVTIHSLNINPTRSQVYISMYKKKQRKKSREQVGFLRKPHENKPNKVPSVGTQAKGGINCFVQAKSVLQQWQTTQKRANTHATRAQHLFSLHSDVSPTACGHVCQDKQTKRSFHHSSTNFYRT